MEEGYLIGFIIAAIIFAISVRRAPKCPECGEIVNKGARRCRHCASEIGASKAARPSPGRAIRVRARRPAAPPPPAAVACPHCAGPVEPPPSPGAYACPHCRAAIEFE